MKKVLLVSMVFGFIYVQMFAQTATPGINKTQRQEQERIKDGIRKGELTKQEARGLERQQAHIQQEKKIAKSDGVVTKNERKHLKKDQAQASKNIFRKKHNNRTNM